MQFSDKCMVCAMCAIIPDACSYLCLGDAPIFATMITTFTTVTIMPTSGASKKDVYGRVDLYRSAIDQQAICSTKNVGTHYCKMVLMW